MFYQTNHNYTKIDNPDSHIKILDDKWIVIVIINIPERIEPCNRTASYVRQPTTSERDGTVLLILYIGGGMLA